MQFDVSIADLTLIDILRPRERGEPVNAHILSAVLELPPDYEAMRRIAGFPAEPQTDNERITSPTAA